MTSANPVPPPTSPYWPHCGHGTDPVTDPIGCRGIRVDGHTTCLAHLAEADRVAYLTALSPGVDLDHRGIPFTSDLLNRLLDALCDPTTGYPRLGAARFDRATFSGIANFRKVTFAGDAEFDNATFTGTAAFDEATFAGDAWFREVTFSGDAEFNGATISSTAVFDGATFSGDAGFRAVTVTGGAWFEAATFSGNAGFSGATITGDAEFDLATFANGAWFDGATFTGNVGFRAARFEMESYLGPLICDGGVRLDRAVFQQPVKIETAARWVSCERIRWASTATLHLRYATLDLSEAVFEHSVLVAARPDLFSCRGSDGESYDTLSEAALSGRKPGVRLESVSGVDAAQLALHDVDLSGCRFAGAVHLDQLKVDGWCTFATTPTGWDRRFPWRLSRRNTLTEEHHWRVRTARYPDQAVARGWTSPWQDAPELKPAAVAALYRQLRKSLEDGKNEPDAADFYYGECEMRRHDTIRPFGERVLLTAYWALSGYGLRATRALGWLVTAMAATIMVMMLWGLPIDAPKPQTTGQQVRAGQNLVLTTDTPDPRNPTGPWTERVATGRFEKALRVVINSVVFRSSDQDLTTAGTYTEMTSRLTEPVLLGLAVLAARSRVKR
ncbi:MULTISPECIES: pentapeptide repeat-containing protein [unclassified Streptomyces]|uniref:pentapeptide repeat-containing protein n=1 Tax=unclassified Streptomyces TaxID=2593676 RepID=UPI0011653F94|nr:MULTISPECIES: pentapeptide repeat-containing protein [unclassified Streptomyces]NMI60940.1 pentapeptide repeat-containing protein [Streptomyces sp. RLA2-12]QDN60057.1 pentapeptide repeat-containing protein [Streptomyces sp. S1D4-20]QDN70136.1 pentapeptide repeat-containing protein [Streptomyces sp. S1D4-14]